MTRDPKPRARRRRRCLALLGLVLLLPASGCGFLLNEFTWLDRAPPAPAPVPLAEQP